jgi:hypothetical protein
MLIIDLLYKVIVARELLAVLELQPIRQPILLSVTRELFTIILFSHLLPIFSLKLQSSFDLLFLTKPLL